MFCIASLLLPTQPQFARSDSLRTEPIEEVGGWEEGWVAAVVSFNVISVLWIGA